jgi:hypothetical protein
MKKLIILLVLLVLSFLIVSCNFENMEKQAKEYNDLLGEKIVLNKDTLVVVGFDDWGNTYRLSNGVKIDIRVAQKLKIK